MAYTPVIPSINTTVTNNSEPSGWKFLGFGSTEDVPRRPQAAMDGPAVLVGLPVVIFSLRYLTMDVIPVSTVIKERVDGTQTLSIGTLAQDNPYLIGGSLTFQDTGRGILACTWEQRIACVGQRIDYP